MSFYNPYHFIPVTQEIPNPIDCQPEEELSKDILGHRSFDRFHEETLSGKIICTLQTQAPVVIGGKQEQAYDDGYTRVRPFERIEGEPAVPASGLRGCISSIAEAASNSALRVLQNKRYSRRVSMQEDIGQHPENYSAMGLIVEEDQEIRLKPLAMPTLKTNGQNGFKLPSKFRNIFQEVRLKAFCYTPTNLSSAPDAYSQNNQKFYYAKLQGNYSLTNGYVNGSGGKEKTAGQNRLLLGYSMLGDPVQKPPEGEEDSYTRGILRVLSAPSRTDIPQTKKHEIFIPYTEEMENLSSLQIKQEALTRFKEIAIESETENKRRLNADPQMDTLPYCLKGGIPLRDREYNLQSGDIVFFEPNHQGQVEKLWISQIWRDEIPQRTYDFFQHINKELLPFNKQREKITPAEALFGFVEEEKKQTDEQDRQVRALAGRIRFSEAKLISQPEQGPYYEEVTLRILASPKPPCPSFYFKKNNLSNNLNQSVNPRNCYISKRDLNINRHVPQGRKFYLHPQLNQNILRNAKTRHPDIRRNQKNKVSPLRENCKFVFHIDFHNLSRWELGLLIYSLEPNSNFYHKIGMAKALGLGSVKIEIAGLFLVDRQSRYSIDGFADENFNIQPRYSKAWLTPDLNSEDIQQVDWLDNKERYAVDNNLMSEDDNNTPQNLKNEFMPDIQEPINKSLQKIGLGYTNVKPPLAQDQNDPEEETFQWFQNNDLSDPGHKQGLAPLEYGNGIVRLENN